MFYNKKLGWEESSDHEWKDTGCEVLLNLCIIYTLTRKSIIQAYSCKSYEND